MTAPSRRLTLGLKINFAVGNVGMQMLAAASGFFLMIFYTDVALLPPALAGAALLVGKIWDTVSDPFLGWMTDRTRSRHGRRRVYLIYGAFPLALLGAAIWTVPAGLSPTVAFIWVALTYTLFDTVVTLVQLPYSALAAEITRDYDERTSLVAISSVGALIGYIAGSVAMPLVVRAVPDARAGYALAGAIFGMLAGASVAWVAWRVPEPPLDSVRERASPPWTALRSAAGNRSFVTLLAAMGLVRLGLTILQTALAYEVIYQLQGGKQDMPKLMAMLLGTVGVSLYFWKRVVDRWEKNYAYILGLACSAAGLIGLFWLPPGHPAALTGVLVTIGLGMGAHWVVPYAMMPDTVDHDRCSSGERRTGMYMGLYGLIDKLARTIGTAVVAGMLALSGYAPNVAQSAGALLGIRFSAGLLPALCLLLAIPFLLAYPITRERHRALIRDLESSTP